VCNVGLCIDLTAELLRQLASDVTRTGGRIMTSQR